MMSHPHAPQPRNDVAIESEENIVGGIFVHPPVLSEIAAIVRPPAFTHPGCRAVYSAMLELHANAEPIDVISVWNRLKQTGNDLTGFGGIDYLTGLYSGVITVSNLDYHAKRIADKALRRRAFKQLREASEHIYEDDDVEEVFARARRDLDDIKPAAPEWITPEDRALAIGGETQKLATDFATLDKATRGGLRSGKVIVFGGAPGAGKTTWAIQLAWKWARAGIFVAVLAADEDADGLLVRIGQLEGLQREDLEDGLPYARKRLSERLRDVTPRFQLVDADETGATVEAVSERLARDAEGKPTVFVVDSIQTVRSEGSEDAEGPRARIDAVIAALKKCAKVDGHLVIATCELARGAYRSQNAADRIDDLAAFKESGGIEYGVTTALVLRSVATENGGEEGLVDVSIPKNRLGSKTPFRIRLDYKRASFEEVELPQGIQESDTALEQIKCRVLETVGKALDPIASKNELARRTRKSKKPTLVAIDELLDEGRLMQLGGVFKLPNGHTASMPAPSGSRTGSRTASPVSGSSGSISQRDWNREPEPVPGTKNGRSVLEPISHLSASSREPGEDDE
jgi:replicative DNA helicase